MTATELSPRRKRFGLGKLVFIILVAGAALGFAASMVESSVAEPFKLAANLWEIFNTLVTENISKSLTMFWFGITNLKLYYIFFGLLFFLLTTGAGLMSIGILIGAYLGGALYWLIAAALASK